MLQNRKRKKEEIMRSYRNYQNKKNQIVSKTIVGIDPGKKSHQAVIINPLGIPIGKPISFSESYKGYHVKLWKEIQQRKVDKHNLIFAIEVSCNLWQKLTYYLETEGYEVVHINPLCTKQSRSMLNNDFSKTDNKDALLIALNAQQGYYNERKTFPDKGNVMHSLSIAYDKLRKDYSRYQGRLRAALELVFPEFLQVINLGTQTSYYLLEKFIFPKDFLSIDIDHESIQIEHISRKQYGIKHLKRLQGLARQTIGIQPIDNNCDRTIILTWLHGMKDLQERMKIILGQLKKLASPMKEFTILIDLMGISDETASLFLAEIRDIDAFDNYKEIEKFAGYNLRLKQSSQYVGARRISHIGNKRLRWILYRMTEETAKYIPEVRIKYLKRQLKKQIYRKNLVACIPQLLKLIFCLLKEKRNYENNEERIEEMKKLDAQYQIVKAERAAKHRKKYKLSVVKEDLKKSA